MSILKIENGIDKDNLKEACKNSLQKNKKPMTYTILLTNSQLSKIVKELEKTTNCPSRYNLKNLDCNKKGSNIKCIQCIKHSLLTANKEKVK